MNRTGFRTEYWGNPFQDFPPSLSCVITGVYHSSAIRLFNHLRINIITMDIIMDMITMSIFLIYFLQIYHEKLSDAIHTHTHTHTHTDIYMLNLFIPHLYQVISFKNKGNYFGQAWQFIYFIKLFLNIWYLLFTMMGTGNKKFWCFPSNSLYNIWL